MAISSGDVWLLKLRCIHAQKLIRIIISSYQNIRYIHNFSVIAVFLYQAHILRRRSATVKYNVINTPLCLRLSVPKHPFFRVHDETSGQRANNRYQRDLDVTPFKSGQLRWCWNTFRIFVRLSGPSRCSDTFVSRTHGYTASALWILKRSARTPGSTGRNGEKSHVKYIPEADTLKLRPSDRLFLMPHDSSLPRGERVCGGK